MATFLITGASRGLGLALTRELTTRPPTEVSHIIATVRKPSPSPELDDLVVAASSSASGRRRVSIITGLDVTDETSIQRAVVEVEKILGGGRGLDVLVNNAGVALFSLGGVKSMDNLQESMLINVMGVHWMTRDFLPLLQKGHLKKVVNLGTTLGSIQLAPQYTFMPAPAYKISKAALNALTVQYALDYGKEGFSFMALCPGWLKTDLGGGDMADLTPEQGAKASLDVIYRPNAETNGKMPKVFVRGFEDAQGPNVYDGSDAPW